MIGAASTAVADRRGIGQTRAAVHNVLTLALRSAGHRARRCRPHPRSRPGRPLRDAEEAQAIAEVFSSRKSPVPVVAAKSYFGNLGAASGMVELIASVLALQNNRLFAHAQLRDARSGLPGECRRQGRCAAGRHLHQCQHHAAGAGECAVVKRFCCHSRDQWCATALPASDVGPARFADAGSVDNPSATRFCQSAHLSLLGRAVQVALAAVPIPPDAWFHAEGHQSRHSARDGYDAREDDSIRRCSAW